MKTISEQQLSDYLEAYLAPYRKMLNQFFRAKIVEVAPYARGGYLCRIIKTGDTVTDGGDYLCATPGYIPQVGDDVECMFRDKDTAWILWPVTGTLLQSTGEIAAADFRATGAAALGAATPSRFIGRWTTFGAPTGLAVQAGDWGYDGNGFQWICVSIGPAVWKTVPGGTLAGGYLEVTANQGPTPGSFDLTGLGATVTVGSGRRIRVAGIARFANTVANTQQQLVIAEGATQLSIVTVDLISTARQYSANIEVYLTPSAGSHTYKLVATSSTGSTTMQAAAGSAAFIHVSDVGV